jgi:hypothetical protein
MDVLRIAWPKLLVFLLTYSLLNAFIIGVFTPYLTAMSPLSKPNKLITTSVIAGPITPTGIVP